MLGTGSEPGPNPAATRRAQSHPLWSSQNEDRQTNKSAGSIQAGLPEGHIPTNNMARQRRDLWWKFTGPTVDLYDTIQGFSNVLAASAVSKHHIIALIPST